MRISNLIWLAALALVASCGGDTEVSPGDDGASASVDRGGKADFAGGDEIRMCAAIRGNGQLMPAHFGSLARIHEHYGLLDGIAGGSSASITTFLTESIYANPYVWDCGGQRCSDAVAAQRIALMYKSLEGYLAVLGQTEEAVAIGQLAPLASRLKDGDVATLIETGEYLAARDALLVLLQSEDLRDLINPDLIALLKNSPDPEYHVQEVYSALSSFGAFDADDPQIFIQPGVLNFKAFAQKVGRVGSFYAAYGPADAAAWKAFFAGCSDAGHGLGFAEVALLDAGKGASCGELFSSMVTSYRSSLSQGEYPSRIDDKVGAVLPALVITSVLVGEAAETFATAQENYNNAEDWSFDVAFSDVKFGYWGNAQDLARVERNPRGYTDAKTGKFLNLGEATYAEALTYSPAEPGLSGGLDMGDGRVSVGGWPDLQPVQVLKNMGCDKVIYVTRRGAEIGGFAPNVALLLGMSADEETALYDLGADSAIHDAVSDADARWCTDWNSRDALNVASVVADGYNAPMETTAPFFTEAKDPYSKLSAKLGLASCTPGVAE
jgi:hypothetical protein